MAVTLCELYAPESGKDIGGETLMNRKQSQHPEIDLPAELA
jgi:hypothetical protein